GDLFAASEAHACILDRDALANEFRKRPEGAWLLVKALAERLSEAELLIRDLAVLDVSGRLASALLRFVQTGEATAKGAAFELPYAWSDLALRLGTTPESLSRRLKEQVAAGLVAVSGRRVVLLNPAGLRD